MKSLLKIVMFMCTCLSIAHAQGLLSCTIPGSITQSCYVASGNYSVSSTITISQSNVLVLCQAGVTFTQTTSNPILHIHGNNVTVDGCIFDANSQTGSNLTSTIHIGDGVTGVALRNNTVKNTTGNNVGIFISGGASNVLIEKNTLMGPAAGIVSYSPVQNLQIINNVVSGQIAIQSPSTGGSTSSFVITGNTITPGFGGVCVVVQDASSSGTSPNFDFTISHNICRIQGTDASHHVFGAFSLVSSGANQGNSGACTVADNVVEAYGQFVDYALWEIGLTGCTFSGNMTRGGGDTYNQSYSGWAIYSGNNTFIGNNTVGWGKNGDGMSFYPQNLSSPYANNNVVTGGSLIASNTGGPGRYALSVACNVSGSSIQNLKVSGLLISGALTRGFNAEGDSGPNCPVSVTLDSITISGPTTGLATYTTTIGVQNVYTIGATTRWIQEPGTVVITPQ